MKRAIGVSIASLLLLVAAAPVVFGQAAAINGQIEGTVTDPTGAIVPNATVSIQHVETGLTRELKTDESGFYRFTVLPLGTYQIRVQATGFKLAEYKAVVSAGSTATVNAALTIGGDTVMVDVSSSVPVVEPGRTDLGSTLSTYQTENLPLVSRNPYNFILLQPNVSANPNTEFGVPRKINANGFVDRINYQLDGSNNTESDRSSIRLLPISDSYIGEIQQVNNGFAPEFGNTVGTVFNAITKSGTNELHGEAAYIFRRTVFNARPILLSPTAPKPDLNVDDYFVDAGDKIIKDKLFWYGAFEHVNRDLPNVVTVSPGNLSLLGLPASYGNAIPFSQSVYFYMGKADWQINSANRLSFRFNYFRNESPFNNGGGQTVVTQTYLFKDRAPIYAGQLISTITPHAVNELRFQVPKRYERQVSFEGTGPQPAITISGIINFGGSPNTGLVFTEKTPEFADNFSLSRSTHTYKFGGDFRWILDNQTSPLFTQYTFANISDYLAAKAGTSPKSYTNFQQTFGNPAVIYTSVFSSMFVQDDWKVRPNLTLTYGIRYDIYKPPPANKSSLFAASQNFAVDKNNVAPRIGIAYSIGKDQKTVIRASGGIFYDAPQTNIYYRALLNNGLPAFFTLSTGNTAAFAPAFPTILSALPSGFTQPVSDVTTVSPNFRSLYSSNANFQITREVAKDLSVSASYLYTKGTHIPVYRNINVVPTGALLGDGRPILKSGAIYTQFNNVVMAESVGNSNYNGMNLSVNRRFSKGYEFFATYTWSHAIDDAPEQNVLDSSNLLPEDPTNRRRDRGNSISDRRHNFTANGVLEPHFDVSGPGGYLINNNKLSFIWSARTGEMFNLVGNRNLNGDPTIPASQQRPLFIGRNTIEGPAIYELDLRYSRVFSIRERVKPEFLAEFTNLFNHPNVTSINATASVDALGNIVSGPSLAPVSTILDGRLMQLGIRVSF